LSDTRSAEGAAAEAAALERLLALTAGQAANAAGGRIFYRRRTQNIGRKAGNIAEFIRRSGAEWDYALVLDADSLIEAQTILTMIRRIEAVPDLGLLQSLPRIIRASSRFGRAMQFSAGFHGPVFTRGLARLQGRTGPYWGHNAILRINAFAACCGLSELPGKPPFGGHILSHDYVEAALLARGGWQVRVDPDLVGSYEESPENLVEHAKRDRRWCQGNLQHGGLLRTHGLRFWNRATFVQGIMAYLSSGLWAAFLISATLAGAGQAPPDYFLNLAPIYDGNISFLPVFPSDESAKALGLLIGIFGLLLLPKLLVAVESVLTRRSRQHGGILRAMASVFAELLLSALLAPLLMAFQVRALTQIMLGRDGGWPANMRGDGAMTLSEAYAASRFVVTSGALALIGAWYLAPSQVPWLLPVLVPMILAPLIISWTSRQQRGALFAMPEDRQRPAIVALHDDVLAGWQSSADHAKA
jgi:membrane glycosyltransferase